MGDEDAEVVGTPILVLCPCNTARLRLQRRRAAVDDTAAWIWFVPRVHAANTSLSVPSLAGTRAYREVLVIRGVASGAKGPSTVMSARDLAPSIWPRAAEPANRAWNFQG